VNKIFTEKKCNFHFGFGVGGTGVRATQKGGTGKKGWEPLLYRDVNCCARASACVLAKAIVCHNNNDDFRKTLAIKFILLQRYAFGKGRSGSHSKVIGSRSRSRKQKAKMCYSGPAFTCFAYLYARLASTSLVVC